MKLTRHNGRAGKNGVYNPKHNDRSFDIANSEHIDEERAKQNLYWDCYNGFRNFKNPEKENELSATFEDVEQLFYRQRYRDFVTGQNERNVKNRHPERNKETGDLLKSKKTCPEETVYQIGTLDNHVPPELLIEIVTEFMEIVNGWFSGNPDRGNGTVRTSGGMVEAKIKARCRFGCRAGCRSGCRAKIPKALILRHFSLSDNHDNQYYKEKGNSKKIVSPDKEKRFSDVRCRNFVVRPFLVGLFSFN